MKAQLNPVESEAYNLGKMESGMPPMLTTKQVVSLTGLGERTVWRYSRSGIMPAPVKIGRTTVRFRRDEILEWIDEGCPRVDGQSVA
jgi:excisionase family DNA binding protein